MASVAARLAVQRCARYLGYTCSPAYTLCSKMTYFSATRKVLPDGVFPTMITPMNEDKSVDWVGVDRKCNHYKGSRCNCDLSVVRTAHSNEYW